MTGRATGVTLWVALAVLVIASGLVGAMAAGALKQTVELRGPFLSEAPPSRLLAATLPAERPLACCAKQAADSMEAPAASRLRLFIGEREIKQAHLSHDAIRAGAEGFSHWGDALFFSLPADAPNTEETVIRARIPMEPAKALFAIPIATLLLALWLTGSALSAAGKERRRAIARRALQAAFLIGLSLSSIIVVMDFGVVRLTSAARGPYFEEAPPSRLLTVGAPKAPVECCFHIASDVDGTTKSQLKLRINGEAVAQAHRVHEALRRGEMGFSHWGDRVYFALPADIANTGSAFVRVSAPVRARPAFALFVFALTFLLGWALRRSPAAQRSRSFDRLRAAGGLAPLYILYAVCITLAGLFAAFWAAVFVAFIRGSAVPISAPFQSDLGAQLFAAIEPSLAFAMLVLCAIGAGSAWVFRPTTRASEHARLRLELQFVKQFARLGLAAIVTLLFVGVGASWAGVPYYTTSTVAGLVPFFDPVGYFFDLHWFAREGQWVSVSANRPIASAVRQTLFYASGMNYAFLIALQTAALAATLFWATQSVLRWRGVWPGMAFFAFGYVQARSQYATLMTEPLGLIFAFLAVPFLVRSLQGASRANAAVALTLLTAALTIRLGSAFTIPALALWFALTYGPTWRDRLIGLCLGSALASFVFALNWIQGSLFSKGILNNFAFTLCGLSIGGAWDACLRAYPEEFTVEGLDMSDEYELVQRMMARAIENIQNDPGPLIKTMAEMPMRFLRELPDAMLQGYNATALAEWFPLFTFMIVLTILAGSSLRVRNIRRESLFWLLIIVSALASSTLVYFTDGKRVFIVIYVILGLLAALSFSTRRQLAFASARNNARLGVAGIVLASAAGALCLLVPLGGRAFVKPPAEHFSSGEVIVGSWPTAGGILIVPDDEKLPRSAPAMTLSNFQRALLTSRVVEMEPFFDDDGPTPPFGVVLAPRYDRIGSISILITPPEMMIERAFAWRLTLAPPSDPPSMWVRVQSATPLDRRAFHELSVEQKTAP